MYCCEAEENRGENEMKKIESEIMMKKIESETKMMIECDVC